MPRLTTPTSRWRYYDFNSIQLNWHKTTVDAMKKLKNENYYFKNRIPLSNGPWVINPVTALSLPIMHMTQQWASSYSEHNVTMTETLPKRMCTNLRITTWNDATLYDTTSLEAVHYLPVRLCVRTCMTGSGMLLRWFLLMIAILKDFIELLCPRRAKNCKLI